MTSESENTDIFSGLKSENDIALTQENIQKVWTTVSEENATAKKVLSALMQSYTPLLEGETIVITLHSAVQKDLFEAQKQELLKQIYVKTGSKVTFRFDVNQTQESKLKAYTLKEKYERLVEINPAIAELKNRFGLEFEI